MRKIPIEQGNHFTPEMVQQLHKGMSEHEVKEIMGTPILLNTFNNQRVDYVYTLKKANTPRVEKYLILSFQNGILKESEESSFTAN